MLVGVLVLTLLVHCCGGIVAVLEGCITVVYFRNKANF